MDTDRMQNQFLSNKEVEANLPSHQSINLPNIPKTEKFSALQTINSDPHTGVRGSNYSSRSTRKFITDKIQSPSENKYNLRVVQRPLDKKSAREKSMRALKSTRPTIHIKEGKLLIAGK
ncbi:MAG: hypothetical protein ACK521_06915 [bacterium]